MSDGTERGASAEGAGSAGAASVRKRGNCDAVDDLGTLKSGQGAQSMGREPIPVMGEGVLEEC